MQVNKEIKYNNGKIEIVSKQEHQLSELEKEILKSLVFNGYYEVEEWRQKILKDLIKSISLNEHYEITKEEFLKESDQDLFKLKREAIDNLIALGLVEEKRTGYFTLIRSDENIKNFLLDIAKKKIIL